MIVNSKINFEDLNANLEKVKATGWAPVENWPQTYWKRNIGGHINILTVYVDDFITAGIDHHSGWDSIRAAITTTKPDKVGRVLGVHFNFETCSEGPYTRKVTMDMDNYIGQALNMCE